MRRRNFLSHAAGAVLGAAVLPSSACQDNTDNPAAVQALPEDKSLRWSKKGLVIKSAGAPEWRAKFSAMVSVLPWEDDQYRVYLTGGELGEDRQRRFEIGWLQLSSEFEVGFENPMNPVLSAGRLGAFDCSGVCMPTVIRVSDSVLYMYYVGWGLAPAGFFQNDTGLAVSRDNGVTWRRFSEAPVLPRDSMDPIGTGTAFVLREADDCWRMWYTALRNWEITEQGRSRVYYRIRYAESDDGLSWYKPKENVAIDLLSDELTTARPCVVKDGDTYRMWFSHAKRGSSYRIGYAESRDALSWTRMPSGIAPSSGGWDSEMVEYAYVLKESDRFLMFYNGNQFGQDGTGLAVAPSFAGGQR